MSGSATNACFRVTGGSPLSGEITPQGKNAALPLLAAACLSPVHAEDFQRQDAMVRRRKSAQARSEESLSRDSTEKLKAESRKLKVGIPLPNIPLTDVPPAGTSCRDAAVRISVCQLCVFATLRLSLVAILHRTHQADSRSRLEQRFCPVLGRAKSLRDIGCCDRKVAAKLNRIHLT